MEGFSSYNIFNLAFLENHTLFCYTPSIRFIGRDHKLCELLNIFGYIDVKIIINLVIKKKINQYKTITIKIIII